MQSRIQGKFSVVIPTLQRSPDLWPLVEELSAHPLVHEVLVINNVLEPLSWPSAKVRVLQQQKNIFVNPAWNLGAREAAAEYLAFVNDDVRLSPELLHEAHRLLRRPWVKMVGVDVSYRARRKVRLAGPAHTSLGFGVFMALRRSEYVPIPGDLLIWGGDDYLFWTRSWPPLVLMGEGLVKTDMGATTGSEEFQRIRAEEVMRAERHLGRIVGSRWWHRYVLALERARKCRR